MIPAKIFTNCPGCGVALELQTLSWEISLAERDAEHGGGNGIALGLVAFGGHVCWEDDV